MGIEAVFVDLGGVWLQDGDFSRREQWATHHGLSGDELYSAYLAAIGPGWEGGRTEQMIHRDLLASLGVDDEELPELLEALHAHETLDAELTEFLSSIRPSVQVGIITNAGPSARQQLCAKFPLDELADTLVVSAEEGISKPNPRIYLTACDRLGVQPPAAVFIDDKQRNVDGARAVGMHAVLFTTTTATIDAVKSLLHRPDR